VIRPRFADLQPDDPAAPVDWRIPSLITASLFLNFAFWYGPNENWPPLAGRASAYFSVSVALLIVVLFYIGPAILCQRRQQPLLEAAANSLGSVLTYLFRLNCILFLTVWIAQIIAVIVSLCLTSARLNPAGPVRQSLLAAGLVVFLFATGLQGPRISARLAWFTNRLGLAILLVAFIRVRHGLLSAWQANSYWDTVDAWRHFSILCAYAGPLLLLASGFGGRCRTRKQVALIGACGLVLPIAVSLFAAALTPAAGHARHFHNIAVALWSGDSLRYVGTKMTLAAITLYGTVRFSAAALAEALPSFSGHRTVRYLLLGLIMCVIAVLSLLFNDFSLDVSALTNCVGAAFAALSGVLTADAIAAARSAAPRRFDWVGIVAFAIGFLAQFGLPLLIAWFPETFWQPWLLPSYAISLTACLLGRAAENIARIATTRTSPV